jgi:DNA-directed RNA polymerase subunit alpha
VRASAKIWSTALFRAQEGNELAAFDAPVQRSSQQFDPILLRRWMSLS